MGGGLGLRSGPFRSKHAIPERESLRKIHGRVKMMKGVITGVQGDAKGFRKVDTLKKGSGCPLSYMPRYLQGCLVPKDCRQGERGDRDKGGGKQNWKKVRNHEI